MRKLAKLKVESRFSVADGADSRQLLTVRLGAVAGRQRQSGRRAAGRVLLPALLLCLCCRAAPERIRYAIPEELGRGSLVGPLARDLGLSPADVPARKLRIVSGDEKQYFTLGEDNTNLRVNERIDREGICGAVSPCVLTLEAVVEKPFSIFHVSVTIQDINDNPPQFDREFVAIEMIESTPPGARIPLSSGRDPDIGANSLQNYQLTPNPLFSLVVRESPDGTKHVELVLEKSLDREKQSYHHLILTAVDAGDPVRSGTAQIKINVTDANDNPPVFTKEIYKVRLLENLPEGSIAFQVKATDGDEGTNAEITYSFSDIANSARQLFALDSRTGDVKITGPLDHEEGKYYEASVEGKDGGGLSAHAKVHIDILDVNDNAPTLSLLPILNPTPEDAAPSTVVALINVRDRDSGDNGEVSCNIDGDFPFRLEPASANAYKLVIASALDREKVSAYNITITAGPGRSPALSSRAALGLEGSDVNDNAPVFEEAAYSAYVAENNAAGAAVVRVRARDADAGANGRVSYWLAGGSPALSATATLHVVLAESLQEALPELSDKDAVSELTSDLNIILVVALAVVSLLFVSTVILILFFKCRRSRSPPVFITSDKELYSSLGSKAPYNYCSSTLPLPYSYEVCLASESGQKDFTFLRPGAAALSDRLLAGKPGSGTHSGKDPPSPESSAQPGIGEKPAELNVLSRRTAQ
ncbi:PREDICTED: LOW QUALITY PROTEIN: protocadherin gamma-B3-like [Aptenodytes forsteri]|uniref:LOW QUALITY PROTEIN: protocadherin gamma-B3-like n=1 Tax=Aptenodytes forsteri TaxID=9233 RepID=UPI0009056687|nr:PREDICTED: LOW QUALITY PROTEIN: protocadherin gamma-B3-like [Aptenodytes forsteri]